MSCGSPYSLCGTGCGWWNTDAPPLTALLPFCSCKLSWPAGTTSVVGIWLSPVGAACTAIGSSATSARTCRMSVVVFANRVARLQAEELDCLVELRDQCPHLQGGGRVRRAWRVGAERGDAVDERMHGGQGRSELIDQAIEGIDDFAEFVVAVQLEADAEVTGGHGVEGAMHGVHGPDDAMRETQGPHGDAEHDHDEGRAADQRPALQELSGVADRFVRVKELGADGPIADAILDRQREHRRCEQEGGGRHHPA